MNMDNSRNVPANNRTICSQEKAGAAPHGDPAVLAETTRVKCDQRGIPEFIGGDDLRLVYTPTLDEITSDAASCGSASSCTDVIEESSSPGWVWKVAELPRVPLHAPLERAALRIADIPVDTISSRISNFMRMNSITCSYPTDANGRVDCLTSTCIKFVIQLWRADDDATVLEIQRRRGCVVGLKYIKNSLYKSVLSGSLCFNCGYPERRPSKLLQQKMCNELYEYDTEERSSKRRRSSTGQLVCVELLESEKVDENRLGIEALLGMTNAENDSCQDIARALVYNEGAIAGRLRQRFLDLLCAKVCGEEDTGSDSGLSDEASLINTTPRGTQAGDTHLLALKALTNSLVTIESYEADYLTNDTTMLHLHSPFWGRVLKALVFNLYESSHHPQEAALSAKCLRILESLEPETVSQFIDGIVAPLLKTAHEFGKAHHWALEKESEELLRRCTEDSSSNLCDSSSPQVSFSDASERAHYSSEGNNDTSTIEDSMMPHLAG